MKKFNFADFLLKYDSKIDQILLLMLPVIFIVFFGYNAINMYLAGKYDLSAFALVCLLPFIVVAFVLIKDICED